MNFSKELLNQNRVLQMSHNRKGDYLIIDPGQNNIIVIAVKRLRDITDVMFIKEFNSNKKIFDFFDKVFDICFEFNISKILIDSNGIGAYFYDSIKKYIKQNKKCNNLQVIRVFNIYANSSEIIVHIYNDIESGKLRLLQATNCAKNSYIKSFLGYSEIMNSHRETDKLINEMNNVEINASNTFNLKMTYKDNTISHSRINCLFTYYDILCDKENK